jgi:hypothetical protein
MQIFRHRLHACLAVVTVMLSAAAARPQQPHRPAYDGANAPDVAREIHIDRKCRIVPDPAHPLPGKSNKLKPFRDSVICSLESQHDSDHLEERVQGNQILRFHVRVLEQTFVLQNITADHVVFVVEQDLPEGWTIDSDPQPNRFSTCCAIFPVHAQPGEIVHLHVGLRHTDQLKPKLISGP